MPHLLFFFFQLRPTFVATGSQQGKISLPLMAFSGLGIPARILSCKFPFLSPLSPPPAAPWTLSASTQADQDVAA